MTTLTTRQQPQPNNKALIKLGNTIYPGHGDSFVSDDGFFEFTFENLKIS